MASITRKDREMLGTALHIISRNAEACPSYGYAKHTIGGRDKTWDQNWSNGQTKLTYPQPATDGLIVPYGSVAPWGPAIDQATELLWLIATSDTHAAEHAPLSCQHGRELATTVDTMRANAISAGWISSSGSSDDDDGVQISASDPVPYDVPLPATLRRIELEQWSSKCSPIIKWSLKRSNRDGTPRAFYWAGEDLSKPINPKTGRRPGRVLPDIARVKTLRQRIEGFLEHGPLTPEQAEANKKNFIARAEYYGKDWQLSLVDPTDVTKLHDEIAIAKLPAETERMTLSEDEQDKLDYDQIVEGIRDQDEAYGESVFDPKEGHFVFQPFDHRIGTKRLTITEYENLKDAPSIIISSLGPWLSASVWEHNA